MPRFNIHWRGCPHHHFPRIKLASAPHRSHHSRSQAHTAAVEVTQLPFGPDLDKARLRQQMKARARRRKRSSLGTHSLRRASQQVPMNIRGSGREVSQGAQVRGYRIGRNQQKPQSRRLHLSSKILPADGQSLAARGHVVPPNRLDCQNHPLPSFKNSQSHPSAKPCRPRIEASNSNVSTRHVGAEYNRREPNDVDPKGEAPSARPTRCMGRIYDSRLPLKRLHHRTSSKSFHGSPHLQRYAASGSLKLSAGKSAKSTRSTSSQTASVEVSRTTLSSADLESTLQNELPSRTPSQLVALKRFGRELERHLVVQNALRKAGLSHLSPSPSSLSAITIVEFLPYMAEFQAAGLAVTSAEQRLRSRHRPKKYPLMHNAMNIFDNERGALGYAEQPVNVAGSPNKAGLKPDYGMSIRSDVSSAGTTVITFSSPIPRRAAKQTSPNKTTRSVLPWLRRAHERVDFTKLVNTSDKEVIRDISATSVSTCGTCASTIVDFSSKTTTADGKQKNKHSSPLRGKPADVKWVDMDGKSRAKRTWEAGQPYHLKTRHRPQNTPQHDGANSGKGCTRKTSVKLLCPNLASLDPTLNLRSANKPEFQNLRNHFTQNTTRDLPLDPLPTAGISLARFKCPPKLMQHQQPAQLKEPQTANRATEIAVDRAIGCQSVFAIPPDRSPPSPPSTTALKTPAWTSEIADASLPGLNGYEQPSIFEHALRDIEVSSQLGQLRESKGVGDQAMQSKGRRRSGDPVKKRPDPSTKPPYAMGDANMVTTSSFPSSATRTTGNSARSTQSDICKTDILEGLKVAMVAARNKEVDSWITEMSGCRVRRFLADLRVFEGLGANALVDEAARTAKGRRRGLNTRVTSRGSRDANQEDDPSTGLEQTVSQKDAVANSERARQGLLIDEMVGRRQARAREGIRERALEMGWRERSVSTGC